jgi:hypothetical protein
MTTENHTPQAQPQGDPAPLIGLSESPSSPASSKRTRTGKIARFPNAVRDKINNMLRDGKPHAEIINSLGEEGTGLIERNISRWKQGGYQDWLVHQEWLEDTRAHQDHAMHLLRQTDAAGLQELSLQLAATRIYDLLRHLDPAGLADNLHADPQTYTRIFAILPRIAREALRFQKYRDIIASARAQLKPVLDPKAALSESQRMAILRHVDETLGISTHSETPPTPEPPQPT